MSYKKSIKCPHCGERIYNIGVWASAPHRYSPHLDKITKRTGTLDGVFDEGFCPKCHGDVERKDFEVK